MQRLFNGVYHANPLALIVIGCVLLGVASTAFAWVTWPDGFTGVLKTAVSLLTSVLSGP